MCSTSRLLVALVAGASALQERIPPPARSPESPVHHHRHHHHRHLSPARVLLFGCSLDRYAVEGFCGNNTHSLDFLHFRWCHNETLNTRIGGLMHPGVGFWGDLGRPIHRPYRNYKESFSTNEIFNWHAKKAADTMLGGQPDLVVVDSSLWDLAVWKERVQCEAVAPPGAPECGSARCSSACGSSACACNRSRTVSEERVQQWCNRDLRGLLTRVKSTFPTSRVAFRTAPTIIDKQAEGHEWFTSRDIEMLYECVTSSTQEGKLFGEYELVDYRMIVKQLADRHALPSLFREDGYHPNRHASALYIKEVLKLVGVRVPDPEPPRGADIIDGPNLRIAGGRHYDDDDDFPASADDDVDGYGS